MNVQQLLKMLHSLRRLYFLLLMVLMTFAGFALIVFGRELGEVVRDVGISLLIAGTVGLGVELYNRSHGEELLTQLIRDAVQNLTGPKFDRLLDLIQHDSLRELGVRKIFLNRLTNDFVDYIRQARPSTEIRLLGISMSKLADRDVQEMIIDKLRSGCRFKWLLLDPDSEAVARRAEAEGWQPAIFKKEVEVWSLNHQVFVQRLEPAVRGNIELRHYGHTPCCFLVDNGSTMLVGFYLRSCSGERVPHLELEIKDGEAYLSFRRHFDSLWAEAATKTLPFQERRKATLPVQEERRRAVAEVA